MTSHLSEEQRRTFRRLLEDELETLRRRMAASEDTVKPVKLDPGAVGRLSRMDEMQNQMMSKSLRDREGHRLFPRNLHPQGLLPVISAPSLRPPRSIPRP